MTASDKIAHLHDAGRTDAKEIASTVRLIGPQEAAQMLETMKYEHQRTVSRRHVALLASEMEAGRFVGATTIRIAYLGDKAHLIDGQHRLSAIVASKRPQIFTVIEENAPSADYIAWAYGNLDTGRGRAPSDLYRPMGLHDQLDLTPTQINSLSAAVDILAGGMARAKPEVRPNKAERMRVITLYAPYMRELSVLISGAPKIVARSLGRGYVVAVALVSLRWRAEIRHPETTNKGSSAALFWRGAATDDRLASKDPRKLVHRHLTVTSMKADSVRSNGNANTTSAYGARYIANCYNAYMKGESRAQTKVFDETAPFKMIGIPSDPREWLV
jgi:hypothetical protein